MIGVFRSKMLSGRYGMLMMIGTTYCLVILGCLFLVVIDKIEDEFFKGLIIGLAGNVSTFWKDYIHFDVDANEQNKFDRRILDDTLKSGTSAIPREKSG